MEAIGHTPTGYRYNIPLPGISASVHATWGCSHGHLCSVRFTSCNDELEYNMRKFISILPRPRIVRRESRALIVAALIALSASSAAAQEEGWHGKGQLNGNLFFGATQQRLVATQADLARADSSIEVGTTVRFRYGESADADGVRSVQSRSWFGDLSADFRPFAVLSPFIFGSVESSLEQRVTRRESGGAGIKWTIFRQPKTAASLSAAVLAQHTRSADLTLDDRDKTVARGSLRGKYERTTADDRLRFSQVAFYQPVLNQTSNYLITSTSSIALTLSQSLAVTFSFVDEYDSEAVSRGARANNNGQLLLGLSMKY